MNKDDYFEDSFLGSKDAAKSMPKDFLPEEGMDPDLAKELIKHVRLDEAKADQNFATFCTTQMEPQAQDLMMSALNTNAIDKSEYPKTAAMENYCVSMIGHMWGIDKNKKFPDDFIGASTVGSSEACMLGGLGMLFSWKHRAKANGIDIDDLHKHRPNLIIVSGFQVVWEKFCNYWDVEMREVPMDPDTLSLDMSTVMDYVDENTIGIVSIQGITYTGGIDDAQKLDELVEKYNKEHPKMPIHIHVDAASGGFYCPFMDGFKPWDFRLKNVVSINTSGHKYGMVYPGIGWVLWRENSEACLPHELRFAVSYLGGSVDSIAINFSRSGAHIIGQYYNLVRFGKNGYKRIMENNHEVATKLTDEIEKYKIFKIVHSGKDNNLPIVCWKFSDNANVKWTLYDLEDKLKEFGWQVPAYPLPAIRGVNETITVSRIVCRPGMTMAICDDFIEDLSQAIDALNKRFG